MNSIELLQDVLHLSDEAVFENGTTCNFCGNQPHNSSCIIEHIREYLLNGNEQFTRPMVEPDIDFDIEESRPPFDLQENDTWRIPGLVEESDELPSSNIVFAQPTDHNAHRTPSGTPFRIWTSTTGGQETADPLPRRIRRAMRNGG